MKENEPLKIQKINFHTNKVRLGLRVHPDKNRTSQIKCFDKKLLRRLPTLNHHLCDNADKKSFAEELQDTEIAHAFEHALLDIIGKKDKEVKVIGGFTSWDWKKNPRWTYTIEINYANKKIVLESLAKTLEIFNSIT